jgi:hypothetical protein
VNSRIRMFVCLPAVVLGVAAFPALPQTVAPSPPLQPVLHDGRHDFDFEVGTWKAHVRTMVHRLTGLNDWEELDGTVVTRSLPMLEGWNESEMRVDSSTTRRRIEILAVRVYNPVSRQWSIYGSSVKTGVFDPPQVGQFNNGHGEFYGQDTWEGRAVTVRFVWDAVSHDKTHFEQAFSQDGGKTWEVNWIYDGTRVGK